MEVGLLWHLSVNQKLAFSVAMKLFIFEIFLHFGSRFYFILVRFVFVLVRINTDTFFWFGKITSPKDVFKYLIPSTTDLKSKIVNFFAHCRNLTTF